MAEDFYTDKKLKARKDHICMHCATKINRGEIYVKSACVFEGSFSSWKSHFECNAAWVDYHQNFRPEMNNGEGWPFLRELEWDYDRADIQWLIDNHPKAYSHAREFFDRYLLTEDA